MYLADCCGNEARTNGDGSTLDINWCPSCNDHCEYIWEDENVFEIPEPEFDNQIFSAIKTLTGEK